MTLVLDLLISSCRERLGQLLLQMEKIPAYGPMLAAMDAEALQWVKQFPSTASIINATASSNSAANNAGNGGGMSSGGSEKASGQGGIVTAKSKSSGNISSGAVVQVDISSIRRLTIFLQSILITVPIKDRDVLAIAPGSNTQASAKILAIASLFGYIRYTSWIERKSRCDALLSLCNAMVPLSAARKKTSSIGSSAELNAGQRARSNSHNVNQG